MLPDAWRRASQFSDWIVKLTPARARAVLDALEVEIHAVDDTEDASAEDFVIQLHAFPLPGRIGGPES